MKLKIAQNNANYAVILKSGRRRCCCYWTVTPVHFQLLVPLTLDNWLELAELSICILTIRSEAQMLVVDVDSEYRRSSRAKSGPGLGKSKVLSEWTSTIEGIAGWHFPDRNDLMSLTRRASLLSPSSASLRNNRSISAWACCCTSLLYEQLHEWHEVSLDVTLLLKRR